MCRILLAITWLTTKSLLQDLAKGILHSGKERSLFVKHGEWHKPAPHWGACGLQHQFGALRSMLSFMHSSVSSLSVVLGPLPSVSSPPEHNASVRTILSALFPTFQVLHIFHTHLFIFLDMVNILVWSIAPYVSPRQFFHMRGGSTRKRKQGCVVVVCSSGLEPVKPFTFLWSKGGQSYTEGQRPVCRLKETDSSTPGRSQSLLTSPLSVTTVREDLIVPLSSSQPSLVHFPHSHSIFNAAKGKGRRFQLKCLLNTWLFAQVVSIKYVFNQSCFCRDVFYRKTVGKELCC